MSSSFLVQRQHLLFLSWVGFLQPNQVCWAKHDLPSLGKRKARAGGCIKVLVSESKAPVTNSTSIFSLKEKRVSSTGHVPPLPQQRWPREQRLASSASVSLGSQSWAVPLATWLLTRHVSTANNIAVFLFPPQGKQ